MLATLAEEHLTALQQAGIVGGIIAAVVGPIQAFLGWLTQRRKSKIARAKFGYSWIDALFANQSALKFLEGLDVGLGVDTIQKALDPSVSCLNEEIQRVRDGIDWLLLHFDRMEHAISANLTEFEVIRMPVGYYVVLLKSVRSEFLAYAERAGYDRVVRFLNRFWHSPRVT